MVDFSVTDKLMYGAEENIHKRVGKETKLNFDELENPLIAQFRANYPRLSTRKNRMKTTTAIDLAFFVCLVGITILILPVETNPLFSALIILGLMISFYIIRNRSETICQSSTYALKSKYDHIIPSTTISELKTVDQAKKDVKLDETHIEKLERIRQSTFKTFENQSSSSGNENDDESEETKQTKLPKGQKIVKKWPVLDLGYHPELEIDSWEFEIILGDDHPVKSISLKELIDSIPLTKYRMDLHCVTTWSVMDMDMEGLSFQSIIEYLKPDPEWKYLIQTGIDGYVVNVHRQDVDTPNSFIALKYNGQYISKEHGYIRLMIPQLFGWKGCKFLCGLKFSKENEKGFWESRGSHDRGRVWKGERYQEDNQLENDLSNTDSNNEKDENWRKLQVERILDEGGSVIELKSLQLLEIPNEITQTLEFTFISNLNLDNNLLTHVNGISILKKLTRLNLNNNQFSEFPIEICSLPKLNELFIMNNKLTSVPSELSNCKQMNALWFDKNQIETLPIELSELTDELVVISLYRNNLKYLPKELSKLTFLRMLNVAENPLLENIPVEYCELTKVSYFGLDRCKWENGEEISSEILHEGAESILKALRERYNQLAIQ